MRTLKAGARQAEEQVVKAYKTMTIGEATTLFGESTLVCLYEISQLKHGNALGTIEMDRIIDEIDDWTILYDSEGDRI